MDNPGINSFLLAVSSVPVEDHFSFICIFKASENNNSNKNKALNRVDIYSACKLLICKNSQLTDFIM